MYFISYILSNNSLIYNLNNIFFWLSINLYFILYLFYICENIQTTCLIVYI